MALEALPIIHEARTNSGLRRNLSLASLFAGLAISQTRTAMGHSISYPLTLKYGIEHGIACGFSMLEVYKYNPAFIKDELEIIAFNVKQDPYIVLEKIFSQYEINPYIAKYLPNKSSFDESTEDFIATGRFENNIRPCSRTDLINIIAASYHRVIS